MSAPGMLHETIGRGDDLVLVPGGLTGWISWRDHAQALSQKYRVTRVQLVAVQTGLDNEPLPAGYELQHEVDALAATIDALGIEKLHLAGWSYGAATSLVYALHNPDRIASLTLIEPPAIWVLRSRGTLSDDVEKDREAIRQLGPGNISEEQLLWFTHFAGFVPRDVDSRTLPQWASWMRHRQSVRTQDVVFRHEDSIDRVRKFDKSVLLIKGEGSSKFLHDIQDILSEEFPNVDGAMYPGGHAPHILSGEAFSLKFNKFLEEHPL